MTTLLIIVGILCTGVLIGAGAILLSRQVGGSRFGIVLAYPCPPIPDRRFGKDL